MKMAHRMLRLVSRLALVAPQPCRPVAGPRDRAGRRGTAGQSGTVANAANGIQVVNISGIDPAKSFLIFETRHNINRPVASALRGRIPIACANPCTTIEFERVTDEGAPATINIQWYVVTFVTGVRVQRGETVQDALVKNVTLPLALSAVNQAFVIWSKTMLAITRTGTPTMRSWASSSTRPRCRFGATRGRVTSSRGR